MSIHQRRERERAERHQLIIRTARELAEAEGWDAVTTRRLAERIEYSQPVLYSHFAGKTEIVAAVAVEGFAELAAGLRTVVAAADGPAGAFAAAAREYLAFGLANPALYDAMFTLVTDLPFGRPEAPASLHEAFEVLAGTFAEAAGEEDPVVFTEVGWAALHGLVTLARGGRLQSDLAEQRVDLLVRRLLG
ncbi:TetR/AcrR family transcriptional regulator [Streptomyces rubellomurinus]|uniref:TetR family transcriptional regulator n=2 Tax=Streptomyces TaxID=1883 RepID=A0A0F2TAD5_STRR3|nr:TetR/AcrR family transcriptional regulator [Streptomyces rubellomurinus]KJS54239.1 TetR family transcriptional regulator [Streptomyces rubellomurinus subsp. indigoferus]KJS59275.1 TetR family transcriptional regulator [Streptomyces rubellomurinus]